MLQEYDDALKEDGLLLVAWEGGEGGTQQHDVFLRVGCLLACTAPHPMHRVGGLLAI